ncbi:IPT/TIG domain-containing protein [Sphingobacterium corticibacterium]|uniref:IPT/TIG domain-containing protein n=1 Tax=Sphingobacterium corticibacterium TaxID=2484746 RepID=A0A4Q6XJ72_9SPHI|nr:IPT/TIG domain-containing protein [Sphingobacterium corticibacterium]RZF59355.1 hypothetical protein EWE74_09235 [Sphingobacterium corticibacterium]
MNTILWNLLCMFVLLGVPSCAKKTEDPDVKVDENGLFVKLILPNVAEAGSTVQVQGRGFGDNPGNVQVKFGDVSAEVLEVRRDVISVKVPSLTSGSTVDVHVYIGGVAANTTKLRVRDKGESALAEKDTLEWIENKSPNIAAIRAGIPAYDEQVVKYIRNGRQLLEVELGKPVIVAVADRELPWGFFNFPGIRRSLSGQQISVSWSMSHDNAESYGQAVSGNSAVSSDEGETWTRVERAPTGGGILLSNGDRITVSTPAAIPVGDLDLPPVLATFQDGSNYDRLFRIYEYDKLPLQVQGTYQHRIKSGTTAWVAERGTLVHPNLARYSDGNLFPVVWWGDMHELSDGIYRGTYPTYETKPGGGIDASGVTFYKSTDLGLTWTKQGNIPYQPDLMLDPNGNKRKAFGWTEPAFAALKNGTFLSVLRTQDGFGESPMYVSTSTNKGVSWTKPKVFTGAGVLPKLLELDNEIVALASGRPGVQLRFMLNNNADDWSEPFEMLPWVPNETFTCGYTGFLKVDDNSFLVVYSDFWHRTPEGERRKAIKVRKVTVKRL